MARSRFFFCLLLGALCFSPAAARAQEAGKPPPSAFQQLFPQPTGLNGYEEIVMAGELARGSETIAAALEKNATLAAKRRTLAEPGNVEALRLLRVGLSKPIRSPFATFQPETLFPHFAAIRQLARLLAVEQYVLFADGKTGVAIDSLRDGLRLSALIKGDLIIGGLTGIAMDRMMLDHFAGHLDQLSARDCERLLALVRESLSAPDPAQAALETERTYALGVVERMRGKPSEIADTAGEDAPEDARGEIEAVRANPAAAQAVIEQLAALVNAQYAAQLAALRLPPWKRPGPKLLQDPSPAGRIAQTFLYVTVQVTPQFTRDQALVQILGVHAAIRRFRWENDRLPESLDELRLGDLAVDPFTGRPLIYRRTGETAYELSSTGRPDRQGEIVAGEGTPVTLPFSPRPTTP